MSDDLADGRLNHAQGRAAELRIAVAELASVLARLQPYEHDLDLPELADLVHQLRPIPGKLGAARQRAQAIYQEALDRRAAEVRTT